MEKKLGNIWRGTSKRGLDSWCSAFIQTLIFLSLSPLLSLDSKLEKKNDGKRRKIDEKHNRECLERRKIYCKRKWKVMIRFLRFLSFTNRFVINHFLFLVFFFLLQSLVSFRTNNYWNTMKRENSTSKKKQKTS